MSIFHLAIPVNNLEDSKKFYGGLGAEVGREYSDYIIFKFFEHQLVCHVDKKKVETDLSMYPRHFGIIFEDKKSFDETYNMAKKNNLKFFEEVFERYSQKPAWHWSFFLADPSNNVIEFKFYKNQQSVFSK